MDPSEFVSASQEAVSKCVSSQLGADINPVRSFDRLSLCSSPNGRIIFIRHMGGADRTGGGDKQGSQHQTEPAADLTDKRPGGDG